MPHPCEKCRFEGFCAYENEVCRSLFFAIAEGADVSECPEKVWRTYHGIEGVFA